MIEEEVGRLLAARKLTLAVAESCTGGLIAHKLTNVPGSSEYFIGGVVAYAYEAKEKLLGVRHNTLYDYGAVSEPVARQMARGVRRVLGAEVGLSVTGIAGPGGGLPGKPVGLTWIAVSTREAEIARQFVWESDRQGNKELSALAALEMVVEFLGEYSPATPPEAQRGG
ncbi:MAG: CinA family protein [Chloroflexi bacterium]|nr:CinA family protein [Chloroflexota bacterium]